MPAPTTNNKLEVKGINYEPRIQQFSFNQFTIVSQTTQGTFPNTLESLIVEDYFKFRCEVSYGDESEASYIPGNIRVLGEDGMKPLTYLKVFTTPRKNLTNQSRKLRAHTGIYVNGLITLLDNPTDFTTTEAFQFGSEPQPSIARSFLFEHFGTVQANKPGSATSSPGEFNDDKYKRFSSEFVVLEELRIPQNASDTPGFDQVGNINFSGVQVYNYDPLASLSTFDNPIAFNYNDYSFECKITPSNIIQDQISNFGKRPTILVEGTYLLM